MEKLRIMSNNVWCCDSNLPQWLDKGYDCSAEHRAVGFVRTYSETKPDIIGLQECTARLSDNLMQLLSQEGFEYALIWGRDTPILYRKDKFDLIDSAFHIYSEGVPGFEGSFNNAKTKSYCIGVFKNKKSGEIFVFGTTHLWWKSSETTASPENYQKYSDEARTYQINLFIDHVEKLKEIYACPSIIVGDFNTTYNSEAIQSALLRGYKHAYDIATEYRDETKGFHYCYADGFDMFEEKKTFLESIDHILVSGNIQNRLKRFERYYPPYYMPLSDHFPVWVDIY